MPRIQDSDAWRFQSHFAAADSISMAAWQSAPSYSSHICTLACACHSFAKLAVRNSRIKCWTETKTRAQSRRRCDRAIGYDKHGLDVCVNWLAVASMISTQRANTKCQASEGESQRLTTETSVHRASSSLAKQML